MLIIFSGESSDRTETVYCTTPEQFYNIVFNDAYKIRSVFQMSEHTVGITYKCRVSHQRPRATAALAHACFTTSRGRCLMYRELAKLGDSVWYMGTLLLYVVLFCYIVAYFRHGFIYVW